MNNFKNRIKDNLPKDLNQQEIADKLDISISTLKGWISGRTKPTFEYLEPLAKILNKSVNWLITGQDTNVTEINIYDVEFSAGCGAFIHNENIDSQISFPDEFFDTYNLGKRTTAGVFIKGDSMEPKFYSGDIVIIDTSIDKFDSDGIYAFQYDGACFIKNIQLVGSEIKATSINPLYESWIINPKCNFQVVGKVKASISKI